MNRKGQLTIELIIISIVALIMMLFIFDIFDEKIKNLNNKKLEFRAREIADKIAHGINSVHLAGNNAKLIISLPNKINNNDYNITIFPVAHLVEIKWLKYSYTVPIVTANINNTVIKNKSLNLTNVNGKIYIQQ